MPSLSSGRDVRWATSSTMGISSTTPISKNSGSPTSAAAPAMAHGRAPPGTRRTMASTTSAAPPESTSMRPTIAPSATRMPTLPKVSPTPFWKLATALSGAKPAAAASTAEPSSRAKNGLTFNHEMSATTAVMASSAATTS